MQGKLIRVWESFKKSRGGANQLIKIEGKTEYLPIFTPTLVEVVLDA